MDEFEVRELKVYQDENKQLKWIITQLMARLAKNIIVLPKRRAVRYGLMIDDRNPEHIEIRCKPVTPPKDDNIPMPPGFLGSN